MIVSVVAFTLAGFVVDPVVILVTVDTFSGVASGTTDGALDAGVLVLSVVAHASALLGLGVEFPEVGGVAGPAHREGLALEAAGDRAGLADVGLVGEVLVDALALVVLELPVDAGLAGLAVLGVVAEHAVLDGVGALLAGAVLVQELVAVDALADVVSDFEALVAGLALGVGGAGQAAEGTGQAGVILVVELLVADAVGAVVDEVVVAIADTGGVLVDEMLLFLASRAVGPVNTDLAASSARQAPVLLGVSALRTDANSIDRNELIVAGDARVGIIANFASHDAP